MDPKVKIAKPVLKKLKKLLTGMTKIKDSLSEIKKILRTPVKMNAGVATGNYYVFLI